MSLLVKINQSDNVAIAVQPLSAGSEVEGIHINQDIPQAHKVALADIPAPWRHQFVQALRGSAAPAVPNVGPCAWLTDWQQWVMGIWHRESRAEGLQP